MNTLHNHSKWSDGIHTIREMALAAQAAGADAFGISDHLVLTPKELDIDPSDVWWMPPANLEAYVTEAKAVKTELTDEKFKVFIGLEADYFPETVDRLRETLALYDFDYVIGAVHYAGKFPIDHSAANWERLTPDQCHEVWRLYIDKLLGLTQCGCFDWVAHLDLPKKFGYPMPDDLRPKMREVINAIADVELAIELNTAGLDKECREVYPAEWMLEQAVEQAIPVALTSDAHSTEQIVRHFRAGLVYMARCGVEPAPPAHLFGRRQL